MHIVCVKLEEDGTLDYLGLAKSILRGQSQNTRGEILVKVPLPVNGGPPMDKPPLLITRKQLCRICGRGRPRQDSVSLWRLSSFLEAYLGYPKSLPPPRALPALGRDSVAGERMVRLPATGFTWGDIAHTVRKYLWEGHEVVVSSADNRLCVILGESFLLQSNIGKETNPIFAEYRIAGFLSYFFYGADRPVPGVSHG